MLSAKNQIEDAQERFKRNEPYIWDTLKSAHIQVVDVARISLKQKGGRKVKIVAFIDGSPSDIWAAAAALKQRKAEDPDCPSVHIVQVSQGQTLAR